MPYVGTSSAVFEIGPEVALRRSTGRPRQALLASRDWPRSGAASWPSHFARRSGASTASGSAPCWTRSRTWAGRPPAADYDRIVTATTRVQVLRTGIGAGIGGEEAAATPSQRRRCRAARPGLFADGCGQPGGRDRGRARSGSTSALFPCRASRRRRHEEPFSTEITIEIAGELPAGTAAQPALSWSIPRPGAADGAGHRLRGGAAAGLPAAGPRRRGLHLPETLLDPAEMVRRLERFDTRISRGSRRRLNPGRPVERVMAGRACGLRCKSPRCRRQLESYSYCGGRRCFGSASSCFDESWPSDSTALVIHVPQFDDNIIEPELARSPFRHRRHRLLRAAVRDHRAGAAQSAEADHLLARRGSSSSTCRASWPSGSTRPS